MLHCDCRCASDSGNSVTNKVSPDGESSLQTLWFFKTIC